MSLNNAQSKLNWDCVQCFFVCACVRSVKKDHGGQMNQNIDFLGIKNLKGKGMEYFNVVFFFFKF